MGDETHPYRRRTVIVDWADQQAFQLVPDGPGWLERGTAIAAALRSAKAAGKVEGRAEMKAEAVGVCRDVETGRVTTARSCADAIEALK